MHLPQITQDKPGVLVVEKASYHLGGPSMGATALLPTGAVLRGQVVDRCLSRCVHLYSNVRSITLDFVLLFHSTR